MSDVIYFKSKIVNFIKEPIIEWVEEYKMPQRSPYCDYYSEILSILEKEIKIGVVGLGKLGLPLAACLSESGFSVFGMDNCRSVINSIKKRQITLKEKNLEDLLKYNPLKKVSTDYGPIKETDMCFVIVPTPSKSSGDFSDDYLEQTLDGIASNISKNSLRYLKKYVVSIMSTVSPGTMTILQKKYADTIDLVYNPTFIALGEVIKGLQFPDLILIGAENNEAGDLVEKIQRVLVLGDNVPFFRTNYINAELAKLSINSYVTMKITFANTLAEICEKIPGANVDEVTSIIGKDSRIGNKYLKGGMAYGGPCFSRDNRAFVSTAKKVNVLVHHATATDRTNKHQKERLVKMVKQILEDVPNKKKVAILGKGYKFGTEVTEESPSLDLYNNLIKSPNYKVSIFSSSKPFNLDKVLSGADLIVITQPIDNLCAKKLVKLMKTPRVLDCMRYAPYLKSNKKIIYKVMGVNDE